MSEPSNLHLDTVFKALQQCVYRAIVRPHRTVPHCEYSAVQHDTVWYHCTVLLYSTTVFFALIINRRSPRPAHGARTTTERREHRCQSFGAAIINRRQQDLKLMQNGENSENTEQDGDNMARSIDRFCLRLAPDATRNRFRKSWILEPICIQAQSPASNWSLRDVTGKLGS